MKITEKTKVKSICGIDSNITVEKLINSIPERLSVGDIESFLKGLNEGFYDFDEFTFDGKEFSINIQYDDWVTQFLDNCFGEKYLMMVCTRFCYQNFDHDSKGEIWQDPGMSIDLVESIIEGDGKEIFKIITKGHYENEIDNIDENNFLTDEEKKEIDICEDDILKFEEKYERYYDANYSFYFIKKAEFNKDEWWKGWTCQEA